MQEHAVLPRLLGVVQEVILDLSEYFVNALNIPTISTVLGTGIEQSVGNCLCWVGF